MTSRDAAIVKLVPREPSLEEQLERAFDKMDRLADEQRVVTAEIATLRRRWADQRGHITPPRVETLRREVMLGRGKVLP